MREASPDGTTSLKNRKLDVFEKIQCQGATKRDQNEKKSSPVATTLFHLSVLVTFSTQLEFGIFTLSQSWRSF
jgi:hypothetical protein